ncbi:U2 small nuclear ribonucleoprotein, putative [Eimeria maxima]|uniref:U2 small nuclear ribonucleoprotein, putative n=1 Tax=Eimeria maxima TaxID=5804 RepID=U6MGY7_EIMMA|nr:U2 small nuclear ribonucleoprotein, putative [Eimeria maxima]CDJ61714.1 U2 small nuclear ribonucleoprotein, putative [Eimeria maxima]
MRLTIETILQAPQYKSPAQNWTINLRGEKDFLEGCQLDTIENLGATEYLGLPIGYYREFRSNRIFRVYYGCQLDTIENLGATGDYFECIDLSDNQIIKLQDIPPLYRLNSLIVCNNRVTRIAPDIMSFIPNLESLVLTNNRIERLVDLVPLFSGKNLRRLVLQAPPRQAAESIREAAAAADAEDKANTLTNQQREAIKVR